MFDNDGTLWSEQPIHSLFIANRVRARRCERPQWKEKEPFASVLRGDLEAALVEMLMATHAGTTTE